MAKSATTHCVWTWLVLLLALASVSCVSAAPATIATVPTPVSIAATTTVVQTTIASTLSLTIAQSSGRASTVTVVVEELTSSYVVTYTPTPTMSATPTPTTTPSVHLDTRVNVAWGVTGALLIITGLPMAFWGHKNRWRVQHSHYHTYRNRALIENAAPEINPPAVKLQALFFLACVVAGVGGGGVSIFWWKGARYFVGCWGGFALGLYIQCFHNGGVIHPIGLRYLLYVALGALGFTLSTFPKIHYPVLLASTALVGSTAFILGVDCLTTAGLKEFYISNLGFGSLFTPFVSRGIQYPVSQTMMIELGLIAAVTVMGIAVQMRFYKVLLKKLKEIREVEAKREKENVEKAAERFNQVQRDLDEWEQEHGDGTPTLGGDTPGPKDLEMGSQGLTSLPALDLGGAADAEGLSAGMVKSSPSDHKPSIFASPRDDPELREKLAMLEEIRKVRQNIETLRSVSPPSASQDIRTTAGSSENHASTARPPRSNRPKVDVSRLSTTLKLPDDPEKMAWDEYTKDRKLFTPPSGVSAPIPTTPIPVSAAVKEALERRTELEKAFVIASSDEDGGKRHSRSSGPTLSRPASRMSVPMTDGDSGQRTSSYERGPMRERKHSTGRLSDFAFEEEREERGPIGSVLDQSAHLTASPVEEGDTLTEKPRRASMMPLPTIQPSTSVPKPEKQRRSMSMDVKALLSPASITARPTADPVSKSSYFPSLGPTNPRPQTKSPPILTPPAAAVIPRRRPASPSPQPSPFTTPQSPEELAAFSLRHRLKLKAMQEPLSREEEERRKLEHAKERWERSRSVEKQVMERREKDAKLVSPAGDDANEVPLESRERASQRQKSTSPGVDKVLQWQKVSSSATPSDERRLSRQSRRYSGEDGRAQEAERSRSSVGLYPPIMPPASATNLSRSPSALAKRSSTSKNLDTWNSFSSPGSARPPPN
ncbi:hypothetical protein FRB96_004944 [Tulasnella sp. 330]|nr:hypothetical protein FRB96_004944 [Tulasnella sp. 330]